MIEESIFDVAYRYTIPTSLLFINQKNHCETQYKARELLQVEVPANQY